MKDNLQQILQNHQEAFSKSFTGPQLDVLDTIARELIKAFKNGNKLLLCGNGGSAADAQHIAAEFIGRFKQERRSLPAIALTTDSSILTALANDYSYDRVFARQVEGLGQKGDVFLGISTSGNSPNVLQAADTARELGLVTIGFSGQDGGALGDRVDICYRAQSKKTPHIQEMHITALHAVSEVVEHVLFSS